MKRYIPLMSICVVMWSSLVYAGPPIKESVAFDVEESFVLDCGDFNILSDYSALGHTTFFFDNDGNLVRELNHYRYINSSYYNSNDPTVRVYGSGEVENLHWDYVGDPPTVANAGVSFSVKLPGYGVVFIRAGRLVFDLTTFEIVFEAGPNDLSTGNFEAFCAALRASP